jgi:hypothetical protein
VRALHRPSVPATAIRGEQGAGKAAARLLSLLNDVDGVLEADHRVERESGAADDRAEDALALLELKVSGEIAGALAESGHADHNDDGQADHLDRRQHDVELHRLGDASSVDGGHDQDGGARGEHERFPSCQPIHWSRSPVSPSVTAYRWRPRMAPAVLMAVSASGAFRPPTK